MSLLYHTLHLYFQQCTPPSLFLPHFFFFFNTGSFPVAQPDPLMGWAMGKLPAWPWSVGIRGKCYTQLLSSLKSILSHANFMALCF